MISPKNKLLGKSAVAAPDVEPPAARRGREPIEKSLTREAAPFAHVALVSRAVVEEYLGHDPWVRRHFGAAGTSPYLDMTESKAALSGGPPALTTLPTSLKYWAPMSGDSTIMALATSVNGFEKP